MIDNPLLDAKNFDPLTTESHKTYCLRVTTLLNCSLVYTGNRLYDVIDNCTGQAVFTEPHTLKALRYYGYLLNRLYLERRQELLNAS